MSLKALSSRGTHNATRVILLASQVNCYYIHSINATTFFKPSDAKIIEEEYVNLKKDVFKDMTRFVWTNAHDFLMIDEVFYKNLQKININI